MDSRWSPATDKAADVLLDKMEKQWMAMFQQTGVEGEFREKLAKYAGTGSNTMMLVGCSRGLKINQI